MYNCCEEKFLQPVFDDILWNSLPEIAKMVVIKYIKGDIVHIDTRNSRCWFTKCLMLRIFSNVEELKFHPVSCDHAPGTSTMPRLQIKLHPRPRPFTADHQRHEWEIYLAPSPALAPPSPPPTVRALEREKETAPFMAPPQQISIKDSSGSNRTLYLTPTPAPSPDSPFPQH